MKFKLPLPPMGINKMYYTDKNGRRRKDTRISDWRTECLEIIKYQYRFKPDGRVLEVDLWFFCNRNPDIDAYLKSTLDMLQEAGIFTNDANLFDVHLHKRYDHEDPRIDVEFEK